MLCIVLILIFVDFIKEWLFELFELKINFNYIKEKWIKLYYQIKWLNKLNDFLQKILIYIF